MSASSPSAVSLQPAVKSRRALPRLLLAVVLFCTLEFAVFRSGWYTRYLEPDSTAGSMQIVLHIERQRYQPGTPRVLALGDSRMALLERVADGMTGETPYRFDTISLAGTHPRCWYYMLRDIDPDARHYSAIVIPLASYQDEDLENLADADVDIYYLVPLLRLSDALDFSMSFESWDLRRIALQDTLFKGLAYKRDLWAFAADPHGRMNRVHWARTDAAAANYAFVGPHNTMEGLQVDWDARKIVRYPDSTTPQIRSGLRDELLRPTGEYTGKRTAYLRKWLGRIVNRYRGSPTRLIFMRLPRGPLIRPYVVNAPTSAVREIAARADGVLIDKDYFDQLEQPPLFRDALHLNEKGCEEFTVLLVRKVTDILRTAGRN